MENKNVGIKLHDCHHGLNTAIGGITETELYSVKKLGAAIHIGLLIKDHETIKDMTTFYSATGELKIQKDRADKCLKTLEELGFVRLQYHTGNEQIKRIDITVPSLPKIYEDFGDYFNSENPNVLSREFIQVIDRLSQFPHKETDIISDLSLDHKNYDIIKDIGKKTAILDTYNSPIDSKSIIFSPLYWDENPQKLFELQNKYNSKDVSEAVEEIKRYQGISSDSLNKNVIKDGILLGCFPTLSVNSTSGNKKFVFTPRIGVGKEEKSILHKARVLMSCVRYGENFAGITKIYNPEKLINALSGRGYIKGHSESLKQYESARNLGLVKLIPNKAGRYEVHYIDNVENNKAVQIAIEMLQVGETAKMDNTKDIAKKILLPGQINHPTQTRLHIIQDEEVEYSQSTAEKLNDLIRGVDL